MCVKENNAACNVCCVTVLTVWGQVWSQLEQCDEIGKQHFLYANIVVFAQNYYINYHIFNAKSKYDMMGLRRIDSTTFWDFKSLIHNIVFYRQDKSLASYTFRKQNI